MRGKTMIRRSFSRAASTYDQCSSVQMEAALALSSFMKGALAKEARLSRLPLSFRVKDRGMLLDIGCGTGALLGILKDRTGKAVGCDMALPMLLKAKERHCPGLMAAADFEALPFRDSSFTAAASSLAFQWATDLNKAFKEASRVLIPGGVFFFSTFGPRTLKELRESYTKASLRLSYPGPPARLMAFHGPDELEDALIRAGLEAMAVERSTVTRTYTDMMALLCSLKGVGALTRADDGKDGLRKGAVLREAGRIYVEEFPSSSGNGITATYDLIFASARKPQTPGQTTFSRHSNP